MIILTAGQTWDPRSPGKSVTLDLEKPQPGLGALPSPGLRAWRTLQKDGLEKDCLRLAISTERTECRAVVPVKIFS